MPKCGASQPPVRDDETLAKSLPVRLLERFSAFHPSCMTTTTAFLVSSACGYLCGSVPFGYLAGRLKGIDIRQHGSGNIGATNAIRVLGKGIGIPVFILDMLKGWLPVFLAAGWISQTGAAVEMVSLGKVLAGFAAVLGHMFTFWLGFKGGKGIATTGGVLIGVSLAGMIGGWIGFLTFLFAFGYVSLGSLAAAIGVPTGMAIQMWREGQWDFVLLGFGLVVMVLAFLRHTSNIKRLLAGTENKAFGKKKSQSTQQP